MFNLTKIEDKPKLSPDEISYFDRLVKSIICYTDHVQFFGRVKRIYQNNVYTTILNESTWSIRTKQNWGEYVRNKFGTESNFNDWVKKNKVTVYSNNAFELSFVDDPNFPLLFTRENNTSLNCYARINKEDYQVKYISTSKSSNFYKDIVSYLRLMVNLPSLVPIKSDTKVIDIIKQELNKGFHIMEATPIHISNSPDKLCFAYVPLTYLRKGNIEAWQMFMDQMESEDMQLLFMAWIYGVFVEGDTNRQILWLEGEGYSGKSTVLNVIGQILQSYDVNLFKSLASKAYFDKFSLEGIDLCRMVILADTREEEFFQRQEVLNLTGGDTISINRKNKAIDTKKVMVKIAVNSNSAPPVNYSHKHETTRLLHIKLDPNKIESGRKNWNKSRVPFAERLESQFFSFLAYAKDAYKQCKLDNGLYGMKHD